MRRCFSNAPWAALAAGCSLLTACVVSPQPEPPAPAIDVTRIAVASGDAGLVLEGTAGAVTPGGARLTAVDLDTVDPSESVDVTQDGSFVMPLPGSATNELRLQAHAAGLRSDPTDIVLPGMGIVPGGSVLPAERPLVGCFVLDPPLEIEPPSPGESVSIVLQNNCSDDVTLSGLPLRLGGTGWTVEPISLPTTVASGSDLVFTVTLAQAGGQDDIVFVMLAAPASGRRPIGLRAP